MNYNNPDFFRRSENFFPKKNTSGILRRAVSKKYKEDNSKNFNINEEINYDEDQNFEENNENIKYNNYTNKNVYENKLVDNINTKSNYNKNFFQTYATPKYNFNTRSTFYNIANNQKEPEINEALLERMKKDNKNKFNISNKKYFTSNISNDNVYQEFIINYDSGMNPQEKSQINYQSNTLDRKKINSNIINRENKIYNRVALNNGIYKVDKKSLTKNNDNNALYHENRPNRVEYFSSTYQANHPYKRRKIVDFTEKEPIENGMPDKIKKQLYFKNNRNNLTNYNFFDKKINRRNHYNYNFNTYNENNLNNFNNIYEKNYNFNISQKDFMAQKQNLLLKKINTEKKINSFLTHFSEYCIQYYHRIINHLFTYLKKARDESITRKYMIITHKSRPKDNNRNRVNLNIKNKSLQKNNYELNNRNYLTKVISTTNTENKSQIINERIPYHKTTELLIDRIRFDNKSKSPDKSNNFEMFRDIKELSKKYEVINYRKNRQNFNGTLKPGNDLSFNSGSIEKNKEKEKWEKILEKEREIKKMKEQNKNNIINVNNNKLKTKEKNNINNNSEVININNIKNKYKKLNLNLNSKNNNKTKFQMKIIKKIQTKDKKIQINIKYLNCYKPNKIKVKKNYENKYTSLQKSKIFEITLLAVKNKYKNNKKENNGKEKKLASIKEEKENKIEVSISDEGSQNA